MAEYVLYRFYDSKDELLYVGMSTHMMLRLRNHRHTSRWWSEAALMRIERFPDRDALADAEAMAISLEKPRYNVIYSPSATRGNQGRRPSGTGGVCQRADGMWVGSVEATPSPEGKRRRRVVYGKDRETVEAKLAALKATHTRSMVYGRPET